MNAHLINLNFFKPKNRIKMNPQFFSTKNETWTNAAGDTVPYKFVPGSDKLKEKTAKKIYEAALEAEAALENLHTMMYYAIDEVKRKIANEYKVQNDKEKSFGKGNFTFYNFDRSVKVEANMNDIVKWNNAMMTEALQCLNTYLDGSLTEANILIKELVTKAFSNNKGMIDTGKVFQLLRYKDKIKNKHFQQACEIMTKAQDIDKTKLYMRVWVKQEDGQYRNINLNFSQI
jgi:hypothetical protein